MFGQRKSHHLPRTLASPRAPHQKHRFLAGEADPFQVASEIPQEQIIEAIPGSQNLSRKLNRMKNILRGPAITQNECSGEHRSLLTFVSRNIFIDFGTSIQTIERRLIMSAMPIWMFRPSQTLILIHLLTVV